MLGIRKIKPGDKITLHGQYEVVTCSDVLGAVIKTKEGERWVDASLIVAHEPAQREFKTGDRVKWSYPGGIMKSGVVSAVSLDKGWLWILNDIPNGPPLTIAAAECQAAC